MDLQVVLARGSKGRTNAGKAHTGAKACQSWRIIAPARAAKKCLIGMR